MSGVLFGGPLGPYFELFQQAVTIKYLKVNS